MTDKTVEDYLKLPYHIEIIREDDEENPGWVARVIELPGCITQGDTFEELGEMIEDAMRGWISIALEDGISVPEPAPDEDYSGKFVVRLPRSLHRQLAQTAEREGVSLNQFINVALARAVEQVNPSIAYPIEERSSQFAVKEKKPKYRAGAKKQ
jgi:antitoxin HicB